MVSPNTCSGCSGKVFRYPQIVIFCHFLTLVSDCTGSCSSVEVFADPVEHMNYLQDFLGQTSVPFTLLQAQSAEFHFCPLYALKDPCCSRFVLPIRHCRLVQHLQPGSWVIPLQANILSDDVPHEDIAVANIDVDMFETTLVALTKVGSQETFKSFCSSSAVSELHTDTACHGQISSEP